MSILLLILLLLLLFLLLLLKIRTAIDDIEAGFVIGSGQSSFELSLTLVSLSMSVVWRIL